MHEQKKVQKNNGKRAADIKNNVVCIHSYLLYECRLHTNSAKT